MSSYAIEELYWGVIILVPLGYAFVDLQAFKRTRNPYLFVLCITSISLFFTSTLSFLMRRTSSLQVDIAHLRGILLSISIIRSPFELFLYSRVLKSVAPHEPVPSRSSDPKPSIGKSPEEQEPYRF